MVVVFPADHLMVVVFPADHLMVVVIFPVDPLSQFRQGLGLKFCSAIFLVTSKIF